MGEKLKGKIKKEPSCMMVVPINVENIIMPEFIYYNLRKSEDFQTLDIYFDVKKKCPGVKVRYNGENYDIKFSIENFRVPKNYNLSHSLSEKNIKAFRSMNVGITTRMEFSDNTMDSFFLQLKVLNCMVPDNAGIIDFSAEKIYSPVWVSMACRSSVPPALKYMFSLQAVGDDDNDDVWIHTHGLKRCGFVELEILGCSKDNYINCCSILNEMASSVISKNHLSDEYEPIFVAKLANGEELVNTWVNYKKGLKYYDKNVLGSMEQRKKNHNKDCGIIFNYPNPEDYENKNLVKLTDLDESYFINPLVMITNEETKRMSVLAQERYSYLKDFFSKSDKVSAIAKVRLKVDEDKKEEAGSEYEHIWFDIIEVKEDKLRCCLSQEPFYISNLHTGDIMEVSKGDLSDWEMFYDDKRISPDSCYLIEEGLAKIKDEDLKENQPSKANEENEADKEEEKEEK